MNKTIRLIQSYLIFGLPFVIAFMIWNTIYTQHEILFHASTIKKIIFNTLIINLMLWFLVFIGFLSILVVMPNAREKTLRRLANLRERDEREEYITGRASRATYLSTLSIMILFLFFSLFSFNIYKIPKNQAENDRHKLSLSIGLHFNLLDPSIIKKTPEGEALFEYKNISLSKSAIVLILICWQLFVFNITARRINKMDGC